MSISAALLLGLVQGISEFLPISSSGHLAIISEFLEVEDTPILFDIFLHTATLLAVLIVFRKKIASLFVSLFKFAKGMAAKPAAAESGKLPARFASLDSETQGDMRLILALIVATAGTGAVGLLIRDIAASLAPAAISFLFVATGVLLILSGKVKQENASEEVSARQALVVGLAQGVGVLPGLSRSGVTISAALFSGVRRSSVGEFSFLLSIPAIIAAFLLELKDAGALAESVPAAALAAGMLAAFVSGLVSMKLLLRLINSGKLGWFACYLIPAGIGFAAYFFLEF